MTNEEMIPNLSRESEERIIKAMANAMAEAEGHQHASMLGERLELERVARRQFLAHKAMLTAIQQQVAQGRGGARAGSAVGAVAPEVVSPLK